jgi:RecA/RadA recombinase
MLPNQYHTAVFGQTGSGKTGTVIHLIEEALKAQVPVVAVDIKGDLANLVTSNIPGVTFSLFTPGASHGYSVSLLAKLANPSTMPDGIQALLNVLGLESSKLQASYYSYLATVVDYLGPKKVKDLANLISEVMYPSFRHVGKLPVDMVLPASKRNDLAVRLNNLCVDTSMSCWIEGKSIDFTAELSSPKVVIYSVAHITDVAQQQMAIQLLLSDFSAWVWRQPGADSLKALLVIDECEGLIPPTPRNPPTKAYLMALFKKARAFGVGVILATQNTKDIDYKALSNCGTWIVGKLSTEHDRKRILEGAADMTTDGRKAVNSLLCSLDKREFVVLRGSSTCKWHCPDVSSQLSGPYTTDELEQRFPREEELSRFSKLLKSLKC